MDKAFLVCATYLSKAIVAYLAGVLILNLIGPKAVKHKVLSLLLGLTLYVLIIGWITGFLCNLLGHGAMWQVWFTKTLLEVSLQAVPEIKKDEPLPLPKKEKIKRAD